MVIDKLEHNQRYQVWRFDPYHHCMTVMVERYVLWLKSKNARGDVIAESRSGKADLSLKEAFERVYTNGSSFIEPEMFMTYLTSRQIKLKPKSANIAGLQLADIIAHPSFRATLARREHRALPDNFGGKIGEILEASKYIRGPNGQIDKWGREWLP